MLIKCKIKRENGSIITLGDDRYHFLPDELGRHVAEVTDPEHIERLLSIDAYSEVSDAPEAALSAASAGITLAPQEGYDGNATDDGRDASVQAGDIQEAGQGDEQGSRDAPEGDGDDDARAGAGQGDEEAGRKAPEEVELEAARELYRERFGKNPHPRAKLETLLQRIEEGNA